PVERVALTVVVPGLEQPESFGPDQQVKFVQGNTQEKVQHENQHERNHKRTRGSAADALRARVAMEAAITAHQRNRGAEEQAFEDAGKQVVSAYVVLGVLPIMVR